MLFLHLPSRHPQVCLASTSRAVSQHALTSSQGRTCSAPLSVETLVPNAFAML